MRRVKVSVFVYSEKTNIVDNMLACGGYKHNDCEVYKINDQEWETITPYPFVLGLEVFYLDQFTDF